jgi:polysaccharide biosynthesis transport protein
MLETTAIARTALTSVSKSAQPESEKRRSGLARYVPVVRRQAWKIGAFVAASLVAAFVISSRLQPVYESTASISIDRTARPSAAGDPAAQAELAKKEADQTEQNVATQLKIIVSDPVLRPVAVKYNLLEREGQLKGLTAEQASVVKDSAVTLKHLRVSRPAKTYLIQISYRSNSPHVAADVANAIAQSYIEDVYRLQTTSVLRASDLALTQLGELKARMERSSEAAARARNERSAVDPDETTRSNASQGLQRLNTEHANAVADLAKKEAAYNSVKSGSSAAAQAPGQTEGLQRLQERLNEAEERAAEIKASKGQNSPEYQREQLELQNVRHQYQALSTDIAGSAEAEYNKAVARERLVAKELAQAKAELSRVSPQPVEDQRLQQEADEDKRLYEELAAKSQEAVIRGGSENRSAVVSDPARPSNQPVFPNLPLNLGVTGVLSCFLGMGMAVLLDSLDKSIRDPEEVRLLFGTELIGALPLVKDQRSLAALPWARGYEASLAFAEHANQKSAPEMPAFEEAIRMLRNSILLSDVDGGLRSILVTSSAAGEGKSTAAMYLAMAHAEQGKKTLLIDADLRRPTLDKRLGISDAGPGLAGAFLGETDWEEAVLQNADLPNLHLLPAGSPSSGAMGLIGGGIAEMLEEAVRVYDLVILDAPPILGFAEPMHLAIAVDGVVVVTNARGIDRQAVRAAISTLNRLRANLIGIVLNRVSPDSGRGSRYY